MLQVRLQLDWAALPKRFPSPLMLIPLMLPSPSVADAETNQAYTARLDGVLLPGRRLLLAPFFVASLRDHDVHERARTEGGLKSLKLDHQRNEP